MKRFLMEIGFSCGALLLVYFAIFCPSLERYKARVQSVQESNQRLFENLPAVLQAGRLEEELKKISGDLDSKKNLLVRSLERGAIATLLRETAQGMNLRVLAEMPWVTHTRRNAGEEMSLWRGKYREMKKKMTLEGDYFAIGRFLEEVQKTVALSRSTKLSLLKEDGRDKELRVDVTLTFYDLHELIIEENPVPAAAGIEQGV